MVINYNSAKRYFCGQWSGYSGYRHPNHGHSLYPPPPPPRVGCSALALACRWVQNQLFDTRFMMAAKRPVRYTCTIRLVRDRKFSDWIKPLRIRWSSFISAFFVCLFFWDAVRSLRQSMSLMICSTSHRQMGVRLLLLVAGAVLAFYCTSFEPLFFFFFFLYFFSFFFFFFLHFTLWKL